MKDISIKDIEKTLKDMNMPEITPLGNGMYNLFGRAIASEKFLLELDKGFKF